MLLLTEAEVALLYNAVGEELRSSVWHHMPDQDQAIAALIALPPERLGVVMSWIVSGEPLPGHDELSMDCRDLLKALVHSKVLTFKECLKLAVAVTTLLEWSRDDINILFEENKGYPVLADGFRTLLPHDALVLLRDFLYGFDRDVHPEMDREICLLWGPVLCQLIDWGPLTGAVEQFTETLLVCVEDCAKFWNALIDTRLRTIDHKQLV